MILDDCYNWIIEGDASSEDFGHCGKDDCTNGLFSESGIEAPIGAQFFEGFTRKLDDGFRKLCMPGNEVFQLRGKRLCSKDIPALLDFLSANPDVIELNLAFNEIRSSGFIELIDHLTIHQEIEKLDVQCNDVCSEGINYMCDRGEKLQLRCLKLNGNKFGPESSKQIALMLGKNFHLRELNVAEVDQTASSLAFFTTVLRNDQEMRNETLKILDISRPNPGFMYQFNSSDFASSLGIMLLINRSLEELHLQKFGFSCHDISNFLLDGQFNKLTTLDLSANNIGDRGAELLSNFLSYRPPMTCLLLARNNISCSVVSRGLPYSRIKHFDVSYNRIDDLGITEILNTIKKSPQMRQLRIFGNQLGPETAKIIHRMLLSGVLTQENLDVQPYRVDGEFYCARFAPVNRQRDC